MFGDCLQLDARISSIHAATGHPHAAHPTLRDDPADVLCRRVRGAAVGVPVVSLRLVDPRFYHLDTALTVLDDTTVAFYPPAFDATSADCLRALFPDAIVLPAAAVKFADQLRSAGFDPVGVDLSELLKGGGSVKCCTLEVHP